ncbi:hypothetical protein I6N95_22375 [Vagococcus sp. BWB3-3]|uniref:Uncharacterized protein n=1 Tax=Vagococcus allomyrinae TaxID=2794353 RepID=A0A940PF79_9ENTE|nr:hypothetical protein [Vagococcus allomyrinae]MBP1043779.1 hypothetical protein [Vagococcus allomyrinae]
MNKNIFLVSLNIQSDSVEKLAKFKALAKEHQWIGKNLFDTTIILKCSIEVDDLLDLLQAHIFDSGDYLFITEVTRNYIGYLPEEKWQRINHDIFG